MSETYQPNFVAYLRYLGLPDDHPSSDVLGCAFIEWVGGQHRLFAVASGLHPRVDADYQQRFRVWLDRTTETGPLRAATEERKTG